MVAVVFVTFDGGICIPIDGKRKSGRPLKRLVNIERNPRVSLLIDEYSDDWTKLRWVRCDGNAEVVLAEAGLAAALTAKYPQYEQLDVGACAIRIVVQRTQSWHAASSRDATPRGTRVL